MHYIPVDQQMSLKLFWVSGQPRSWALLVTQKLTSVVCELVLVDVGKGETKTPEFVSLMRGGRGRAPALLWEQGTLVGTMAIGRVFSRMASNGTNLFPADDALLLDVFDMLTRFDARFTDVSYWAMQYRGDMPYSYMSWAWKELVIELSEFDRICQGNANGKLSSHGLSVADIWLHCLLVFFERVGGRLDEFPRLRALTDELAAMPAVQETYPPHWKENPGKKTILSPFYDIE